MTAPAGFVGVDVHFNRDIAAADCHGPFFLIDQGFGLQPGGGPVYQITPRVVRVEGTGDWLSGPIAGAAWLAYNNVSDQFVALSAGGMVPAGDRSGIVLPG